MPSISDFLLGQDEERQGQTIGEYLLARPTPELRTAPKVEGYVEEPHPPEPSLLESYGPTALRLGGPAVGALLGAPFGMPQVGAGLGATAGEAGARYMQSGGNLGSRDILPSLAAGAGAVFFPAGGPVLAETAAQGALASYAAQAAAKAAETFDPDKPRYGVELPGPTETLFSLGAGAGAGLVAGRGAANEAAATARATEQAPLRQGIEAALQEAPPAPGPETEDLVGPALRGQPQGEVLAPVQELLRTPQPPAPETDTSALLRQAQEAVTPRATPEAPPSPTSTLLGQAQETVTTGRSPFADALLNQRGSAAGPVVSGVIRAGIGGTAGYQVGDTPEEQRRNALIGAGLAAGGPPLISALLRRGAGPATAAPVEQLVKDFGDTARLVEYGRDTGDFKLAHGVANEALENLDTLKGKVGEITPDTRLFRVVADTLMPEGTEKESNLATVSGAGRLLQRYSDLAQRLSAMADAGDEEAGKLLGKLYNPEETNFARKAVNLWRGSLVGKVSTGVRNALDQGTILATTMLDRINTGVAEGFRTGHPIQETTQGVQDALTLGTTAARRTWDGFAGALHLAAVAPDRLETVLARSPELAKRVLAKPEALENKLGMVLQAANKVNEVQETFFRKTLLEAEMVNGLRRAGIDPAEALRNPGMIPREIAEKAADTALKGTLAYKPDGRLGKAVGLFFSQVPEAHLIAPFPRYMANRMQYLFEHSPLGLVRLWTQGAKRGALEGVIGENQQTLAKLEAAGPEAMGLSPTQRAAAQSKAQFNIEASQQKLGRLDQPTEVIGKVLTGGIVPLTAALTLRNQEFAGEHWWEVKHGEQRYDMRPYSTLAGYMFVGELARQIATQGKVTMSQQDIAQGLATMGTRAGVGLTVMDMLSGRGDVSFTGVTNLAADLAAMIPSGFFNPLSQFKDVAAVGEQLMGQKRPPEAVQRDFRDTAAQRLYGPMLNQIPFASRYLPERASPTAAAPKHIENPTAHFFGLNVTTPNAVEQAISRLGIPPGSVPPKDQDKAAVRTMTQGMGPLVEQIGGAVLANPNFKNLPAPVQEMTINKILERARNAGLGHLAQVDPKTARDVLMRRKSKTVQELLGGE